MIKPAMTCILLGLVGCGSPTLRYNDGGVLPDAATDGGSLLGADGSIGGSLQCTTWITVASIKSLRDATSAAHVSGCVRLSNVLVVGRTSALNKPRIYVQDPGGGDYSALMGKCGVNAGHACLTVSAVMQATAGQVVTIEGHYTLSKTSLFEELNIEQLTLAGQSGTLPPPVPVTLTDIARGGQLAKIWFQTVTTTMPSGNPLVMYDFSPPELQTSSGQCPFLLGFAMIPQASPSSGAATGGCAGTTNPPSKTSIADEVLINRFFYSDFNWHTDCACQPAGSRKILLNPTATVPAGSTITGILSYEIHKNNPNAGYQEFLPVHMNDFPIAN